MLTEPTFPREIAGGVWWEGGCILRATFSSAADPPSGLGSNTHSHVTPYLVIGSHRSVLFDTGAPINWTELSDRLDHVLNGRPLDWLVMSHYEIPHAGNLVRLLNKYPSLQVGGNVRDYHLFYPESADRFHLESTIELGGNRRFLVIPAVIKDLVGTTWGYDTLSQVLFTVDAFCFTHPGIPETDDPDDMAGYHRSGDCAKLNTELTVQ